MNHDPLHLPDGSLTLLAARPGVGKTTLALDITQDLKMQYPERQVVLFSLEMSGGQLLQRHPAASNLKIYDDCETSVEDMEQIITYLQKQGRVGLVIVDYLQLLDNAGIPGDQETRQKRFSKCCMNLKRMANKLHVPVLLLSQVSRSVLMRSDHRPQLRDLRQMGSLEQDADQVWFMYRNSYSDPHDTDVMDDARRNDPTCELIVVKNRYGDIGTQMLTWDRHAVRFSDFVIWYERT